jgi:hypothetical protein
MQDVNAWLDTIDVKTLRTVQTVPTATILPTQHGRSGRRALALLDQLGELGRPVEMRPGKVIGEGGMGIVREAEQVALGRVVAIKTLKTDRADPGAAQDLLREAWITGSLEHPNVVPVHHLEIDDGRMPLLILKRIDGIEWSKLHGDAAEIQRRFGSTDRLAWNLGILAQVLNAVRFAHSRGVLHRDLKPSNVMIGNFGEVYLLDWGLAVSLRDDGTGRFPLVSEASELAGTPSYMAPEMLGRGGPPLSERTDVYLAGAVLYELITGHPPHRGTSAMAIFASVATSEPALSGDVPFELAQICRRAMSADPDGRFESIAALQLALQGYLEHRGSERLAAGARVRLAELIDLTEGRTMNPQLREEIYRQLAICQFAFHEALAVWRDNVEARAGLTRATMVVAEYELACGDPRAAVALLSQLDERPHLLAAAKEAVAAQAAQQRELEELRDDQDTTKGRGPRRIYGSILGFLFTVFPLIAAVAPNDFGVRTHPQQITWSSAMFVLLTGIAVIIERRGTTSMNRSVFAVGGFIFLAQTVVVVGTTIMGISVATTQVFLLAMWGGLCGVLAVTIDRAIALGAAGYFTAFLLSARFPEYRLFAMSGSNAVLTIVLVWRWRPAERR